MTSTSASDTTRDAFLGGRLTVAQPKVGYRAGIDPVLLAAAVPARAGETALELGCGVGVAALCLARRAPGVRVTGVELQPAYAALARANADANDLPLEVVEADLRALPPGVRSRSFDHVLMNPPYFAPGAGTGSADPGRDTALRGETAMADWLDVAIRRLAPRGRLTLIQRIERLPEILSGCDGRVGSLVVAPLAARRGRAPHLFLLQARKGGRTPFRLTDPIRLHAAPRHERDGDDYLPEISAIVRDAAGLNLLR
ncbi:N-6 Adenine-specific DNA methylase [Oceanicola granulosus HTCC2516]|uniref:N-6 Adenine-specific DNA methylase n=1 Tax=Oceanicola granulosus (strain ATCC BAA-861 / DSM 15982 / KCTC 12143 / HTCC2516) TaxID=314256 RepID=Q2CCG6_OCEGH|nr:methyltransferase [Oceanicola granulosus]EAR50352.1 N-6 Adenine-specific DNA methylase [Oceanicola granulosus HTCC2516]